jgi:hypothetical protein
MKEGFRMNKLLIASIAVFFFSCENVPDNTVFPTEPQAAFTDGNQEIMAARTPPEPNFEIKIRGSVSDNGGAEPNPSDTYTLYNRINNGSSHVSTPDQHHLVDMNMAYFNGIDCFKKGPYASYMQIKQMEKKKNPNDISLWFWFDAEGEGGNDVRYILQMEGTFDSDSPGEGADNWPPKEAGDVVNLTFDTWSFTTEGNIKKYKEEHCDLSSLPDPPTDPTDPNHFNVTVMVTRTD